LSDATAEVLLTELDSTERRLIGVVIDRWAGVRSWGSALQSRTRGAASQATSAVTKTAQATAATASGGTAAAIAAGKGGVAVAAAGKAAAVSAAAVTTAAAGAATTAIGAASAAAAGVAGAAAAALGVLIAAPAAPAVLATTAIGAAGAGAWRVWRGNLEADLKRVSPGACAGLAFPPGHPLPDNVYIVHPLDPQRYLRLGEFHTTLAAERRAELMQILAALGARQITITVDDDVTEEALAAPTATPHLPEGLRWLSHEPSWLAAAERQLRSPAPSMTLTLDWEDDLGVNDSLVTGLRRAGWSLGDELDVPRTAQIQATF
jgi:hypothetical protein